MAKFWQNITNLFEYVGLKSPSYYHTVPDYNYDPEDTLAYYIDMSPRADYPGQFDTEGIPLMEFEGRLVVFPTHLIMYALGHLEKHRRQPSDRHLDVFKTAADWLAAEIAADGSWPVPIPSQSFNLRPPFRSAMVQGLGISALTRATRIFKSENYAEAATLALKPFQREVSAGGVATHHTEGRFYEEYPCQPPCHVLNGFFYAMWGLYDLVRCNGNGEAHRLWDSGLETIIKWLPKYDLGYWSLYHIPADLPNPATVAYHRLHINQLAVMHAITQIPEFDTYRRRWEGYLDNRLNALRTLPAKLRWLAGRNKDRGRQTGERSPD